MPVRVPLDCRECHRLHPALCALCGRWALMVSSSSRGQALLIIQNCRYARVWGVFGFAQLAALLTCLAWLQAVDGAPHDMRGGLQPNYDYVVVPPLAWIQFVTWYGGGPAFPRRLVGAGPAATGLVPELYPLSVVVIACNSRGQPDEVSAWQPRTELCFKYTNRVVSVLAVCAGQGCAYAH